MLTCVGRISGLTLLHNLNVRKSTADSLMNKDGQLNSHSNSQSNPTSGIFGRWRRNTDARRTDHFELSIAVNTVTETKHEREIEDVRVVTLPASGAPVRTNSLYHRHSTDL